MIPHGIASDPRLSPVDVRVALALLHWAWLSDTGDTATMSDWRLADYARVSEPTVRRSLAKLEKLGLIRRDDVPYHSRNMTGRAIVLLWIGDPSIVVAPPLHDAPEGGTRPEGRSSVSDAEQEGRSPVIAPVDHQRSGGALMGDREGRSPAIDKEDRRRKKVEELPRMPEGGSISSDDDDGGTKAGPMADALDRVMVDAKQAASMQDEPMMREGPVFPSYDHLPEGMRRFLDDIGPDRRAKFLGLSRGKRREILMPHARGFDDGLFPFQVREIERARGAMPTSTITATATTPDLIMAVAGGDVALVNPLAESLCQDFGNREDRERWGALRSLAEQLWRGEVTPEVVLDSHRQAMGPKAKNRGAVFTTALKNHGWRP